MLFSSIPSLLHPLQQGFPFVRQLATNDLLQCILQQLPNENTLWNPHRKQVISTNRQIFQLKACLLLQ